MFIISDKRLIEQGSEPKEFFGYRLLKPIPLPARQRTKLVNKGRRRAMGRRKRGKL